MNGDFNPEFRPNALSNLEMSWNSVILSVITKTKTPSSPKWPLMSSGWNWPTKHQKGIHWQYHSVFNWKSYSEGILIWRVLSVNAYLGMKKSLMLINITFNVVDCATLHKHTYEKDIWKSVFVSMLDESKTLENFQSIWYF